jgi:site-specific recombinase XerD
VSHETPRIHGVRQRAGLLLPRIFARAARVKSALDALVLWLQYIAKITKRGVEKLEFSDFTVSQVERFLTHLEKERGNGIATRNARLAAIHTFARYLSSRYPERLGKFQEILAIPFKRGVRSAPIEYLESRDVEALLGRIDRRTLAGQRDYALFSVMCNTGARVQEVVGLRVADLRLDPPEQARVHGKGNKIRLCPLWAKTAKQLRTLIDRQELGNTDRSNAFVFKNRTGGQLTRFGVRYLLRKYLPDYLSPSRRRKIHPHSLRHTTAIHLLKSGVDFGTISQFLGHSGLQTTMRYARADLDLKRQALAQVFPDVLGAPKAGGMALHGTELTRWLRRL